MQKQMHEEFIRRTFDLAENGRGKVSPNPLVGCVIVKEGRIIAEGYHKVYGGPHAEVNAINAVEDKALLQEATLYVNLEPCAHFGKTPPCADLIVQFPFQRVVISNFDPNPLVSGKGIEKIKQQGIEVVKGVLQKEGQELNKRFFTYVTGKRPYIILKWAQTSDGFIARKDFSSKWISNALSRKLVHRWRSEEDAVMVGTNTVLYDNPKLNVRDWTGRDPLRVYIDKELKVPATHFLLDGTQPTLCYNFKKAESGHNLEYVALQDSEPLIASVLSDLHARKIQSVMVEGGTQLLNLFIQSGMWDEARIFTGPGEFGEGIKAPALSGRKNESLQIGNDRLEIFYRL